MISTLLRSIHNEDAEAIAEHSPETVTEALRLGLIDGYPFALTEAGRIEIGIYPPCKCGRRTCAECEWDRPEWAR